MADRHDYTRELCNRYDDTVRKIRQAAEKYNVDLSKIVLRMKETDHQNKYKYIFYN